MPMLSRRVMVPGASLVCSVESTRWPVRAALTADLGGLEVADLADHDDVRVLPQEAAQGRGEVEADVLVHLHLVDAREVELDRVLGGADVPGHLVQLVRAPSRAWWSCPSRWGR